MVVHLFNPSMKKQRWVHPLESGDRSRRIRVQASFGYESEASLFLIRYCLKTQYQCESGVEWTHL